MNTFIALLRGINVGGHRKIKMADLRTLFVNLGYADVHSYIQSGNVVFKAAPSVVTNIEERIKNGIATSFGFDVPVLVKTSEALANILDQSPYKKPEDIEAKRLYYALLQRAPEKELVDQMRTEEYPKEHFEITAACVYLNFQVKAHEAKLSNNLIERKLKVAATTRNHRTMVKLVDMAKNL